MLRRSSSCAHQIARPATPSRGTRVRPTTAMRNVRSFMGAGSASFLVAASLCYSPACSQGERMKYRSLVLLCLVAVLPLSTSIRPAQSRTATFDLVLTGGRVIDPASRLDGVRNIGISNGTVAAISTGPLAGKQKLDVTDLVVAAGFIDMH